jgi:hypothetical protein
MRPCTSPTFSSGRAAASAAAVSSALAAGVAHACPHFGAACVGKYHGLHRRTPRRQLVNHRHVEIGVGGHDEGAWDRRRRHDELVRILPLMRPLVAQRQALVHAEAVLLVNDDQRQLGEFHICLKQRVGADCQWHTPAADRLQSRFALR